MSLSWTSHDWELFTSMPGADDAALRLNRAADAAREALADAIGKGAAVPDAATTAYAVLERAMNAEAKFGATDTEPDYHAQRLIAGWLADRLGVPVSGAIAPTLWRIGTPVRPGAVPS